MKTGETQLDKDIRKVQETVRDVKHSLVEKILALPDNPNIDRIAGKSGVMGFTTMSSNLGNNWTPEYYDFKKQHEILAVLVNKKEIFDVLPALRKIIETGKHRQPDQRTITFHPDVIEQLKGIIE